MFVCVRMYIKPDITIFSNLLNNECMPIPYK